MTAETFEEQGLFPASSVPVPEVQWTATTLQMVNWGGFDGYHSVRFDEKFTLLTGTSGSGKSTMLDAITCLMAPPGTRYNGASNNVSTGRARGAEQRNAITYVRGKLDEQSVSGSGELQDSVLRGADGPTWGAVALTWVNTVGQCLTAAKIFYVKRGDQTESDATIRRMIVPGVSFDLSVLNDSEILRNSGKPKLLKPLAPGAEFQSSDSEFMVALAGHLGIGSGEGSERALRLLSRIQESQPVRSVDQFMKALAFDRPNTYAAADKATDHFASLEATHEEIATATAQARVLERVPELLQQRETAQKKIADIDRYGLTFAEGGSFKLWALRRRADLLADAETDNREQYRHQGGVVAAKAAEEADLQNQYNENVVEQHDAGGAALSALETRITNATHTADRVRQARTLFDTQTAVLPSPIVSETDFVNATAAAHTFVASHATEKDALRKQRDTLMRSEWPWSQRIGELESEHESLSKRSGLIPRNWHEARLAVAEATGIPAEDLPFVGELIDLADGEEQWRTAAEHLLSPITRVMLIADAHVQQVREAINGLRLPVRLNFEGVPLHAPAATPAGPEWLSSKMVVNSESPFAGWVSARLQKDGTDAHCVEAVPASHVTFPWVTDTGQTRRGARGAKGGQTPTNIGFDNKQRLYSLETEINELQIKKAGVHKEVAAVDTQLDKLDEMKGGYDALLATTWLSVDEEAATAALTDLQAEYDALLGASDQLSELKRQAELLSDKLNEVRHEKHSAEDQRKSLADAYDEIVHEKDDSTDAEVALESRNVTVSDEQQQDLDERYLSLTEGLSNPVTWENFEAQQNALAKDLSKELDALNVQNDSAVNQLETLFREYHRSWPDPSRGVTIADADTYRALHEQIAMHDLPAHRQKWSQHLSAMSGGQLLELHRVFDAALEDIDDRLAPVNDILAELPFGPENDRLQIHVRRLTRDAVVRFRAELKELSGDITGPALDDDALAGRFVRLQSLMAQIRSSERDDLLDVRRHVDITARRLNKAGKEVSTYSVLAGKSGGEVTELTSVIAGAALRYQLGDAEFAEPSYRPVVLDEAFIKSDAEFAGRSVSVWTALGFQLIVGAPTDKFTGLEREANRIVYIQKSSEGFSRSDDITEVP